MISRECPKCGHGNAAAKFDPVFDKLDMNCMLCDYHWRLKPLDSPAASSDNSEPGEEV